MSASSTGTVLAILNIQSKTRSPLERLVATGLPSAPFKPGFIGEDGYTVKALHINDFLKFAEALDIARRVTVLTGTRSRWDAVYAYATRGIQVDWTGPSGRLGTAHRELLRHM